MKRNISLLFLFIVASLLLCLGLGSRALSGSEDRWAEIARNMLQFKDWFHPIINGEIYFDKPLLSYWLIVVAATLTQTLNEFSVRLPCVAAGLLTLFCTYHIARQWFDSSIAWLSVWLMLTSYGFLFWTHTASAEMSNVAMIVAATAWFVSRRERTDFISYVVFYLLCAIGSQMKGLTACVIPLLIITPFLLRENRWKKHLNLSHVAALILSAGFFALPYLGASSHALPQGVANQSNHLSGIDLLIRENIVRFIHPFDHVDPFYSYLYQVPRIVFPWSFLFIAALFYYLPRYRTLNTYQRWLLDALALVFIFFTASGSRRWYYILPIMPFCMILIAAYLAEVREHRWLKPAVMATSFVLFLVSILLILLPIAFHIMVKSVPVPIEFCLASAATLGGTLGIFYFQKTKAVFLQQLTLIDDVVAQELSPAILLLSALLMTVIFCLVLPGADTFRQEKSFALSLAKKIQPNESLVLFMRKHTTTVYYLNPGKAIPVINTKAEIPEGSNSLVIMVEDNDKAALFLEFPELQNSEPLLSSVQYPEKFLQDKSALAAYRLAK